MPILSQIGVLSIVDTVGAFFGPIFGIIVADYYLIKKKEIALLIDVVQSDPTLHQGIMAENIFYQKREQLLLSKEPSIFE